MTRTSKAPTHLAYRVEHGRGPKGYSVRSACRKTDDNTKPRTTENVDDVTCGLCKLTIDYAMAREATQ